MSSTTTKGRKPLFQDLTNQTLGLVLTSVGMLVGCAGAVSAVPATTTPAALETPAAEPGAAFYEVGARSDGCMAYAKKPIRMGVVVDSAIWFKRADGSMTTAANLCGK